MKDIFVFFVLELLLFSLFLSFNIYAVNTELVSIIFIIINSLFVVSCVVNKCNECKNYILFSFLLRLFIMFVDYYHLFPIIHSGNDTERFHEAAVFIYNNNDLLFNSNIYSYSKFISCLYIMVTPLRLVAQYLNVLFGLGVILVVLEISMMLKLENYNKRISFFICFFPTGIILSSILLREAIVAFFIVLSLYFVLKYIIINSKICFFYSVLCVLFSSYMHSGAFVVIVMYFFVFILYDHKKRKMLFSLYSIFPMLIVVVLSFILFYYSGIFLTKFDKLTLGSNEEILNLLSETYGGSAYLTWIDMNSNLQAILFSPLKMFYFIFSPIPLDWRNLGDVLAFVLDSLFYVYFCILILKQRKMMGYSSFYKVLIACILIFVFVFSYGTKTSGTAMRHRNKIYPFFLIAAFLSKNQVVKKQNNLHLIKNNYSI